MADDLLNYSPGSGERPPQAPLPTPTPIDDVARAQSAQDILRPAAYGDKGAAQYEALVAAGQPAPAAPLVSPTPAGLSGMVGATPPAGMPAPNALDPVANMLMSFGGIDPYKNRLERANLARQQQAIQLAREKEDRDNYADFWGTMVPNVFKAFPGQPNAALPVLMQAAQSRGITVEPAALIAWDQQLKDSVTPREDIERIIRDPNTPMGALARIGTTAKGGFDIVAADAAARKAAEDAKFSGPLAQARLDQMRATTDRRKAAGAKMPELKELQSLDSIGWGAWPVTDDKGNLVRYEKGPLSNVPPGVKALNPRDIEAQQQEAKAPLMTIQRAREQVASAKDTSKALLTMLNDPKFNDAKKSLGPDLTTNVAGYQLGPSQFNRIWRNYKDYGGEGNSTEQNKLMEAIGYYTGTGFQAFLAGLRNQKIVEDIRVHIPQPFDNEDTIRSKIEYLGHRYDDVLREFAAGAGSIRSLRKEAGVPVAGSPETTAPAAPNVTLPSGFSVEFH